MKLINRNCYKQKIGYDKCVIIWYKWKYIFVYKKEEEEEEEEEEENSTPRAVPQERSSSSIFIWLGDFSK